MGLRVQNRLKGIDGVFETTLSFEQQEVEVCDDAMRVHPNDLVDAVVLVGDEKKHRYRAKIMMRPPQEFPYSR